MTRIKTSAVSFLNTRPIIYGLQKNPDRFDIQYDIPSNCAEKLLTRNVDLALIPSIEYSRIRGHRNLKIVPDIGVVSHGAVKSVSLFFKQNIASIQKIAVDAGSRTSVALLEIILREKFDVSPELVPMRPSLTAMLADADAALIIGDSALDLASGMDNKLDLGEEWGDLTDGLPFVYSFWAADEKVLRMEDVLSLARSRDEGLSRIREIARSYSEERANGLEPDFFESYLTDNIQYKLGREELDGLKEYYSYCFYYGLINEIPELFFFGSEESVLN